MGTFRLDALPLVDMNTPLPAGVDGLTGTVLLHNARWFTRIRWIVVVVLAGVGMAGGVLDSGFLRRFGFLPPGLWPFGLAGALALLNLASSEWVGQLAARAPTPRRGVAANIWFQIISDLIVLTVLVYWVGPTQTVIAYSYLFHITLACIFFGRRDSFLVTLLSAILFLTTVFVQYLGLFSNPGILAFGTSDAPDILEKVIFAGPTVFVWGVVWYLVSSISDAVRQRDCELDEANKRLMRADEKINLQMLRVTHDLKAPFAGIESNVSVLKQLHWNETPEPVRQIIGKIDARSVALRARIGDILMLGGLRSSRTEERTAGPVDLHGVLEAVLQDVQGLEMEKKVSVNLQASDVRVFSDFGQLKILFLNLISNAIVYSQTGGVVEVAIEGMATRVRVRVVDHGIGISDEALPHIFEDFFRTQEAAAFNPNSTGLGLAIVGQVARNLGLAITVESEQGKGTVFEVFIPKFNG